MDNLFAKIAAVGLVLLPTILNIQRTNRNAAVKQKSNDQVPIDISPEYAEMVHELCDELNRNMLYDSYINPFEGG